VSLRNFVANKTFYTLMLYMHKNLINLCCFVAIMAVVVSCGTDTQSNTEARPTAPVVAIDTLYPDGLRLIDIEIGSGEPIQSGDFFTAHYTGYLYNGEIFDTSFDRETPITFQLGVGQLLAAWETGVPGMRNGGKRIIISPPTYGYGQDGIPGIIPPNDTLRFEIELIAVHKVPEAWSFDPENGRWTSSGILFHVQSRGSGTRPQTGQTIEIAYTGYLQDGTMFDSSHLRTEPFRTRVGLGQVIPGLDEILMDMQPGEKRTAVIPANLAYGSDGAAGIIPPDADLRFDITLIGITNGNEQPN
jgi:peptidylprolyl isomerase